LKKSTNLLGGKKKETRGFNGGEENVAGFSEGKISLTQRHFSTRKGVAASATEGKEKKGGFPWGIKLLKTRHGGGVLQGQEMLFKGGNKREDQP